MKTYKNNAALTILLVLVFAITLNLSAVNPPKALFMPKFVAAMKVDFDFEEEAYINDIPFSTECVSAMCKYNKALSMNFDFSEENYVNDIPFSTNEVSESVNYKNTTEKEFEFEEEAYIDDIPFETYAVTQVYFQSHVALGK